MPGPDATPHDVTRSAPPLGPARGAAFAGYVADAAGRDLPPDIITAAKTALIDHVGVCVGASRQRAAVAAQQAALSWQARGSARIIRGPTSTAALAALVNGTMAHCMDYDDTHIHGGGHVSAPCWAAALALASDRGLDEATALRGFVAGFEVMARLGTGGIHGVGRNMQMRGLHPTSVNGVIGAAATAASMLGLDSSQVANALGAAGTCAGGLVASFGTDSKPFHAGKAAMEGILAADLAQAGFVASHTLLEETGGLLDAFIQDRNVRVAPLEFDGWELLNNGYKPFACCRATHASIQAAHSLVAARAGRRVTRVVAQVHRTAPITAGKKAPRTPLECKFSVPFCIAMALNGYRGLASDFTDATIHDPAVAAIVPLVELDAQPDQPQFEAHLQVWLADGTLLRADTHCFLGHPENPMTEADIRGKFDSLVVPELGAERAGELYASLRSFERAGSLARATMLLADEGSA